MCMYNERGFRYLTSSVTEFGTRSASVFCLLAALTEEAWEVNSGVGKLAEGIFFMGKKDCSNFPRIFHSLVNRLLEGEE